MKKYQKEYEKYIKFVTDNFIYMQTEVISHELLAHDKTFQHIIRWTSGLEFEIYKMEEQFRDGNLTEHNREYNSKIALKYLQENILNYNNWLNKFKKDEITGKN